MTIGITAVEHLLLNQAISQSTSGSFTRLLNGLMVAAKIISKEVTQAGLVDSLGLTGKINVQGEQVRKLDEFANDTMNRRLQNCGEVCALSSEEAADLIEIPRNIKRGSYVVVFDPLDGSSNIDAMVSVGTIFSIFRRVTEGEDDGTLEDVLQPGHKQIAAGYFLYGSSTMLVYTTGAGVNGFTLDPTVGEFILTHPEIRIPPRGKIFSINEGNDPYWDEGTRNYMRYLKNPKADHRTSYTGRYIGSMVADFHRNMLYGGIFMYPADNKDPRKPHGKLRLMCEANPVAFVAEQAGGAASTGEGRIMDVIPHDLHQRVPLICGSKEDVRMYEEFALGHRSE